MTLIEIAIQELIKKGMPSEDAKEFAKSLFIGFPAEVAVLYGMQKFKKGAAAQRKICAETPKIKSLIHLELMRVVKIEVANAPEPIFK